jgi:hypothetical protein
VVDVKEGALGAFKQDVRPFAHFVVQQNDGVLHVGFQGLAGPVVFGKNLFERQRLGAQRFEHDVVFLDAVGELGLELGGIDQIVDAQAHARGLVAVGWADAALGGADLVLALEQLAGAVQLAMIGQNHVRRLAQDEILRCHLDAVLAQSFHFADQADGVADDAIADDAQLVLAQYAGGDEMQDGFLALDDDSMPGVVPAGVTHDHVRLLGEHVNDLAFAFVAPLGTHENGICHNISATTPPGVHNKNPRTEIRGKAAGSLPEEARKMRQMCQCGKLVRHEFSRILFNHR